MAIKGKLANPGGQHLTESRFRPYESMIADILSTFPEPYITKPTDLAAVTVAAGLRSAVNAVLTHRYPTSLDLDLLSQLWPKLHVSVREGKVVVSDQANAPMASVALSSPTAPALTSLSISNPSDRTVSACIVLLQEGAIVDPITFTGRDLSHIIPPAGIVLTKSDEGSYLML